jgi:hypothetical protein
MRLRSAVFGLLAFALSAPASAWDDLSNDEECRIGISWELGTVLFISKPKAIEGDNITGELMSDQVAIAMTNPEWRSLKLDPEKGLRASYTIRFEAEDGSWIEGAPFIGDNMLLLVTDLKWLKNFEYSSSMLVTRDGKRIGQYDWSGFFSPLYKFRRCIEQARAPILEQRRKEQLRKDTPVDPFAE